MKSNIGYPRRTTLVARCLARFLNGEILDHRDADSVSGSYRLAAVVHYLESKLKWSVFRYECDEATPDPAGRKARFARYMFTEDMIAWAGEDGQSWARDVLNLEAKRVAEREAATSRSAEKKSGFASSLVFQHSIPVGAITDLGGGHASK